MKSLLFFIMLMSVTLVLMPILVNADTDQTKTSGPPISQPLVREGTMAVKLAEVLKVGSPTDEAEAESLLTSVGIAPRNGWIADYPVTPDIAAELRTSIGEAADSGRITGGKEEALKTFHDVLTEYNLPVKADYSEKGAGQPATSYSDSSVLNDYYYDEGPPIVTYYAPPPYYGYLYSWVPYPFWWWDFWFPGFFVLIDFDFHGHHHHGHRDGHFRDGHFSNHFRDQRTGNISRIDPASRARGGTLPVRAGTGWSSAAALSGARAIVNNSRNLAVPSTGANGMSVSPSGRVSGPSSSGRTFVPSSGSRSAISGAGRTYGSSGSYRGGSFNQPAYRSFRSFGSPSTGSRFLSSPSSSGRSFSRSSLGNRSFSGPSISRGGFSSFGSRGSFGGSRR